MATTNKQAPRKTPPPNIKFVGRDREEHGKTIKAEPLRKINNGERTIHLPGDGTKADEQAQRAGFYHADAVTITRLYPKLYKLVTAKGE